MTAIANVWFHRKGELARDGWESVVDGAIDGWQYTGIRVAQLDGNSLELSAQPVERIVVPLHGSFEVTFTAPGQSEVTQALTGRANVFSGPTDVLYLPTGTALAVTGIGRVALAQAPTDEPKQPRYIPASEVPVELRGAGTCSRQVQNFGTPATLDASRLIVCEVITPSENWSSYPPHKHDEHILGHESQLEEIYYFEMAPSKNVDAPPNADAFGYMRTYSTEAGEIDTLAEVRSGDIALVPFGWHGPCVAGPGYDMYYLNVMAGPDPERVWMISDDPAHAWIRNTWESQSVDSRLPYRA